MAKKNEFRDKINQFADSIKNKPLDTPIQEVRPVEVATPAVQEAHVNFWTDASLVDRLKLHGVKNRKTIKQMCTEALEMYLASSEKA